MAKPDYSSPNGIRNWTKNAGFTSDMEAAKALALPFRTFCRYKADGLPFGTNSAARSSEFIMRQMRQILEQKKESKP
jgi:hypothetical protein